MPYDLLKKGEVREEWKNQQDGYIIEYGGENALVMFAFLSSPDEKETMCLMKGGLEITFSVKRRVGYFTFVFGEGETRLMGEAPYYPGIYRERGVVATMDGGDPLNLLVLCIDGYTGELKDYRLVTFGRQFSKSITNWCNDVCSGRAGLPVSKVGYQKAVEEIQQSEELEEIHRAATCRWYSEEQRKKDEEQDKEQDK